MQFEFEFKVVRSLADSRYNVMAITSIFRNGEMGKKYILTENLKHVEEHIE